ncbi:MAG: GIY-YIG nuclease family protein [Planctomycetota bacterium]
MDKKYYVYIIRSETDKSLYIGMTENLSKRIWEHNNKLSRVVYQRYSIPALRKILFNVSLGISRE